MRWWCWSTCGGGQRVVVRGRQQPKKILVLLLSLFNRSTVHQCKRGHAHNMVATAACHNAGIQTQQRLRTSDAEDA